jgi:hypothetical protein
MAGCTENPKRFLGIRYDGAHDWRLDKIEPWGASRWENYQVWFQCSKCGARTHDFGLTHAEAISIEKRALATKEG